MHKCQHSSSESSWHLFPWSMTATCASTLLFPSHTKSESFDFYLFRFYSTLFLHRPTPSYTGSSCHPHSGSLQPHWIKAMTTYSQVSTARDHHTSTIHWELKNLHCKSTDMIHFRIWFTLRKRVFQSCTSIWMTFYQTLWCEDKYCILKRKYMCLGLYN